MPSTESGMPLADKKPVSEVRKVMGDRLASAANFAADYWSLFFCFIEQRMQSYRQRRAQCDRECQNSAKMGLKPIFDIHHRTSTVVHAQ